MKRTILNLFMGFLVLTGCQKYLDVKPDKSMAVPSTLQDVQAILDRPEDMNSGYPGLGEIAGDNYFLPLAVYESFSVPEYRDNYIWKRTPVYRLQWTSAYRAVFCANTALFHLNDIKAGTVQDELLKTELRGRALFFRAYAFLQLVQVFAKAYDPGTAASDLGIVLRLNPDITIRSRRSTVQESYDRIIADLQEAAQLLAPERPMYATRPSRAAAYAVLSRTFLSMRDYERAGLYADSALQLHGEILDYKSIPTGRPYPFEPYNEEVVFFSQLNGQTNLQPNNARVDTGLYASYAESDTRRRLFFTVNGDGTMSFTGNYAATTSNAQFNGMTTAELLLIRSECHVRAERFAEAKADIALLLKHRYMGDVQAMLLDKNGDELLTFLLDERRKELLFRGLRWTDLRRLSKEDQFKKDLKRQLGTETFTLPAADLDAYTFLIPVEALENSDIVQN
jgi:hypothetical protein